MYKYKANFKQPVILSIIFLIFIYIISNVIRSLFQESDLPHYDYFQWISAYIFIIFSSTIFLASLYLGLLKEFLFEVSESERKKNQIKPIYIYTILIAFIGWSFLMLYLQIGITTHPTVDKFPLKIVGILVYGRLFIQPIFLAYIIKDSNKLILFLIFILGIIASITSGSRFIAVMFSLPFFFRKSYSLTLLIAMLYINLATISRDLILIPLIDNHSSLSIIEVFINFSELLLKNFLYPFDYLLVRTMGINEVLLTLNYGTLSPSIFDSIISGSRLFFPFISGGQVVTPLQIYNLNDDYKTALGLDIFSNYYLASGGNIYVFIFIIILNGYMMGSIFSYISFLFVRNNIELPSLIIFVFLFLLFFEARSSIILYLYLFLFFISRINLIKIKNYISRVS